MQKAPTYICQHRKKDTAEEKTEKKRTSINKVSDGTKVVTASWNSRLIFALTRSCWSDRSLASVLNPRAMLDRFAKASGDKKLIQSTKSLKAVCGMVLL